MSNDPKDAVVDLSKLVKNKTGISQTSNLNNITNNTQSMITSLNEGTEMIGMETATKNTKANTLRSQETFSKNSKRK